MGEADHVIEADEVMPRIDCSLNDPCSHAAIVNADEIFADKCTHCVTAPYFFSRHDRTVTPLPDLPCLRRALRKFFKNRLSNFSLSLSIRDRASEGLVTQNWIAVPSS
jgi:hypothetical protein